MIAFFSFTKARKPNETTEIPSTNTLIYRAFLLPPSLLLIWPANGLKITIPIEYMEKMRPTWSLPTPYCLKYRGKNGAMIEYAQLVRHMVTKHPTTILLRGRWTLLVENLLESSWSACLSVMADKSGANWPNWPGCSAFDVPLKLCWLFEGERSIRQCLGESNYIEAAVEIGTELCFACFVLISVLVSLSILFFKFEWFNDKHLDNCINQIK